MSTFADTPLRTIEQPALFDYASLDDSTRAYVQEREQRIHARLKRTAEDIIAIGQCLIEVRDRLSTGGRGGTFLQWLQSKFEMTDRHARRFIAVAERFGNKLDIMSNFPISVLYELAAPSTPETVIQMIETGQIPATVSAIREAKHDTQFVPVREFVDNVFPGFTQWQQDNLALGLDRFGDIPENDEDEQEVEPLHEEKLSHNVHTLRVMGSSESPEWYTPQEVIDCVLACFGEIDLDPCSNSHDDPAVPARTLYTREDNGLAHVWQDKVYLNPPYGSEIPEWAEKLVAEYECGNVEEAIALLPGRIDTNWFQPIYAYLMCNVHGRLQFANSPYHSPFPAVIVYLGRREEQFIEAFKGLGPIMRRIG